MATRIRTYTADELLEMPHDGVRRELVHGELREMTPGGHDHGHIAFDLGMLIGQHVKAHDLGRMYAAETGFRVEVDPDTVLAPDVAFVARERVGIGAGVRGYFPAAPDFAAEVVSPNDRYSDVAEKVEQWLAAGTRMVLVVDPRTRSVAVHRPSSPVLRLSGADVIDGDDVVPGLHVTVRDLFD